MASQAAVNPNEGQVRPAGAPYGEAERYPLLDSGRAIAALSVLFFHVISHAPPTPSGYLSPLLLHVGFVGVSMLFVVSGFLLYRPYIVRRTRGDQPPVGPYAIRRALRILPAYWVALTLLIIFSRSGIGASVMENPLLYYGFGQVYTSDTVLGGIGQAWTLCVEITFYVFLPIYAWLITAASRRRQRYGVEIAGLMLMALVAAVFATLVDPGTGPGVSNGQIVGTATLPRYLGQFAAGMGLAALTVWIADRPLPKALRPLFEHPTLAWLIVPPLYWFNVTYPGPLAVIDVLNTIIAVAILWPGIVAVKGKGFAGRVMGNRLLLYAGVVSYGLYLYHYAVVTRVSAFFSWLENGVGRTALVLLVALVGSLAMGMASWYLVERPGVRYAHRFRKRKQPAAT